MYVNWMFADGGLSFALYPIWLSRLCRYSPIALFTSSSCTTTPTSWPAVPDSWTSCLALSTSGALQVVPPPLVYAHESTCPWKPGGRTVQAGWARLGPPYTRTSAARSTAQLMACRAASLLNGARLVLSVRYQNAVSGLTCTWRAYVVPISLSRSAGG